MARVRLEVTAIAAGGDGVGHVEHGGERRAVFVPRSAPGDVLDAVVDWTSRPARATDVRIVTASPARVEPACPHFEACGGCATMHLGESARRAAILDVLRVTVLRAIADEQLSPVLHDAPRADAYRTRARIALHAGRTVTAGFHARGSRNVVAITRCLVLAPPLDRIFPLLERALTGARGDGEASVALGRDGRPVISLAWKGTVEASTYAALDAAVASEELGGVALTLAGVKTPAVIGDPTVFTRGADGLPLEVAPGGFAQANPAVSEELARHVTKELAGAGKSVVELHAGSGNLTVATAPGTAAYLAVESDPAAVTAGRRNLALRGLTSVRFLETDAASAKLPAGTQIILLDPPRTGAADVIPGILRSRALDVMYVSCDPSTLARDTSALLAGGFRARSLHAFDMFPQTGHVESVLHLTRPPKNKS